MKGYFSLLLGSLIVVLMLVAPGNAAKAAVPSSERVILTDPECGCKYSVISGAERNKMVSDLLKSDEFKTLKGDLKKDGYSWNGAHDIEIIQNHTYGDIILVGVPFTDEAGTVEFFAYLYKDGAFTLMGSAVE